MLKARDMAGTGRMAALLRRFRREEDGSMIVFTLFLIIMMLIVGGMAVDLMRFETNRSRLVATADRASLAAADLDQTLSPEAVVRDYFDKAGLLEQLTSITVVQSINSRTVSVTAAAEVNMMFMDLLGIESLVAPAASTAIETITDIEIALVLDVSGSMRSNNKIGNLRDAAAEFVDTVLEGDVNNKISISIVPFNAQVNLGAPLRARYNVTDLNGIPNSNCIDLNISVFSGPGISPTLAMPQSGYFDANTGTTLNASYYAPQAPNFPVAPTYNDSSPTCKTLPNNIVRLATNNVTQLQDFIDGRSGGVGLTGDGNTSITLGMKWGMALLDPGTRPIYTALIGSGDISPNFAGRPYDYTRANTLKVIVLMTDGEHVASTRLDAGYRSGLSPIYYSTGDGLYSIRHLTGRPASAGANEYYWPHFCNNPPGCSNRGAWRATSYNSGAGVTQLTWPQVWASLRMRWVAQQLYARPLSNNNATARANIYAAQLDAFYSASITAGEMDTQLQASCQQARNNGIVVFGIAFEAPANGQTQIYGCSSSPSHYYNASGLEISTAFRSIANQIQSLRLVQ